MTDAYLGKEGYFAIGPNARALTAISGPDTGLSNVRVGQTVGTRTIPGQGGKTAMSRQSLEVKDNELSFEVDANATTWGLLHAKTGEVLYFEHGPRGNKSGMPKRTGHAIISVDEPVDSEDVIRFSVSGPINGAVTEATY